MFILNEHILVIGCRQARLKAIRLFLRRNITCGLGKGNGIIEYDLNSPAHNPLYNHNVSFFASAVIF